MGLLLAPYNNGMRIGQGFNSYTQQICIDDAVVIDPKRPENSLTNTGLTMLQLRDLMAGGPAWVPGDDKLELEKDVDSSDKKRTEEEKKHDEEERQKMIAKVIAEDEKKRLEEEAEDKKDEEQMQKWKDEEEARIAGEEEEEEEEESDKPENTTKEGNTDDKKDGDEKALATKPKSKPKSEPKPKPVTAKDKREQRARERERERVQQALKRAADTFRGPYTRAELDRIRGKPLGAGETMVAGTDPTAKIKKTWTLSDTKQRGPSQIVTYTSRFVNKLSEITDDMNISGSLSIKAGSIGGSGRGAFIDSDKFKESDLNFYISVKVVNQTINVKDALVYNPLPTVNEKTFSKVYGDSFISGFLEGGEFNALVSMKILNKGKKTDIEAEAKVALTAGAAEASANVKIAKQNISNNTETTIQVSWSGGGFIKPMDQPWTIESLTEVAARFPDLVAMTPQRTCAILTKYETLRSYIALKPGEVPPLFYENAAVYTNSMMDTYMDYKNIYRKLTSDMYQIETGVCKFSDPTSAAKNETGNITDVKEKVMEGQDTKDQDVKDQDAKGQKADKVVEERSVESLKLARIDDETRFEVSFKGLDRARRAARYQMMMIVTEVDEITRFPHKATEISRPEKFQSSVVFRERLPKVERTIKGPVHPLTGVPIRAITQDGPEDIGNYPDLYIESARPKELFLLPKEKEKLDELILERPTISANFRLGYLWGSEKGRLFCPLEFLKPNFVVKTVAVGIAQGCVVNFEINYENGLTFQRGDFTRDDFVRKDLTLNTGEKFINCGIETGKKSGDIEERVTAIRLYTNRGNVLAGHLDDWQQILHTRGGVEYTDLKLEYFEPNMKFGYFKGFWGWCLEETERSKDSIYRLGAIWGSDPPPPEPKTSKVVNAA